MPLQLPCITFQALHNRTPSFRHLFKWGEKKKKKRKAEMKFSGLVSFSEHSSPEDHYLQDKKKKRVKID